VAVHGDAFEDIVADLRSSYRADARIALSAWLKATRASDVAATFEALAPAWQHLEHPAQFDLLLQAVDVLRVSRSEAVSRKLAQLESLLP